MLASPPQIQMNAILDFIYPIGSYFITESSDLDTVDKVKAHFGGNWTRVEGRFLYGSSSAGGTGGSNDAVVVSHSHTIDSKELKGSLDTPSGGNQNNHGGIMIRTPTGAGNYTQSGIIKFGYKDGVTFATGGYDYSRGSLSIDASHTHTMSTNGVSGSGKNMPAYRTVYMYRRTG